MQEQNLAASEYFKDKERFADLMNGYVYHGQQMIHPEDILELDPVIPRTDEHGSVLHASVNIVDLMRKIRLRCHVILVALQNQSEPHYAMPVRVMTTDASNYYRQWRERLKEHRKSKDLESGAEFLSGLKKDEYLDPAFTMVIYTGRDAWDGARTLKEMLNLTGLDRMIQKMIADYPINLLEVRSWENLEWFRSDIKEVFGFLKYTQDKEQLRNFIEENQKAFSDMEEEAYDFIASASYTKEMKEIKSNIKTGGGGYDMCKAIADMIQDGRAEGRSTGIDMGIILAQKLIQDNRQEDLRRAAEDPDFKKKLLAEYALDVQSGPTGW